MLGRQLIRYFFWHFAKIDNSTQADDKPLFKISADQKKEKKKNIFANVVAEVAYVSLALLMVYEWILQE